LNWIPSRFQEEIQDKVGDREFYSELLDHWILFMFDVLVDITITLTFLHSMSDHDAIRLSASPASDKNEVSTLLGSQKIDTQSPLALHSSMFFILLLFILSLILTSIVDNRLLVLDLLAVHLVRNINGSTIISYHPTLNIPATTAKFLHERIRFAGAFPKLVIYI
jgi:hypothetical protein